jgi:hypothetical protein
MTIQNKQTLIMALGRSAEELHQHIEAHRKLVSSMLGKRMDEDDLKGFFDFCPLRSRETRLREAIQETIEVLDESRKAFKSKRLEALRKKLTMILVDNP